MSIDEKMLSEARQAWGNGLIAIAEAFETGGIEAARPAAERVLDALYGFQFGPILFKPTLSGGQQTFRPTRDGALSYFVGHNPDYPQDGGFGIKPWRQCASETSACFIDGETALWMGWVMLTDKDGAVTKVDKSWGYKNAADGTLKIVLHHSSLPYQP